MLNLALEGLKGRRSRKVSVIVVRGAVETLSGGELFRMPKHLYPPSTRG
jgi:hypothetical protein